METKLCKQCGEEKPVTEFHRNTAAPDGLQNYCKACKAKNRVKYREQRNADQRRRNREIQRELAWYRKHYPQEGKPWNKEK